MAEKRVAQNGWAYTRTEFEQYYGSQSENYWNEATWPHAGNPASDPVIQSTAEIEVGATEHNGNPAGSTVLPSTEPHVPRPTRAVPGEPPAKVETLVPPEVYKPQETGVDAKHYKNPVSEPMIQSTAEIDAGATEHDGNPAVCTISTALWHLISALLSRDAIPREDGFIDITDGAIFPWWLWASNLGDRTRNVIGEGIQEVHLGRTQEYEVVFNFIRVDNTTASLLRGIRDHFGASIMYTRSR